MATTKAPPADQAADALAPKPADAAVLERPPGPPPPPVLKVTRYDQVSSSLIALVLGLITVVLALFVYWVVHQPPPAQDPIPIELVEFPGGVEDGAIDETLQVDSPEDVSEDPSVADIPDETQIEEVLENVIELSDEASQQMEQQFVTDAQSSGEPGSAAGTGRRALGMGPGESGLPREQRWFVRFSDGATLDAYAQQLDFFGIELGVLLPGGRLVYLTQLTAPRPATRTATSGANESRMYMTWQGGGRRTADIQLFQKAGIDVGQGTIFHFYPRETEEMLARLEREYRNRPVDQIRRTYFTVIRGRSGWEFAVSRQSYLQ